MFKWALAALVVAFIAGAMTVIGFAVDIAKFVFYVFVAAFVLLLGLGFALYKKVT